MGTHNSSDTEPLETDGDLPPRQAANDVGDYVQLFGAVLAATLLIASATNARERLSGAIIVLISAAVCNAIVYLYRHHRRGWTRRMIVHVVVIAVAFVGSIVTVAILRNPDRPAGRVVAAPRSASPTLAPAPTSTYVPTTPTPRPTLSKPPPTSPHSSITRSPAPIVVPTHYTGPVEISPGYGVDVDDPGNDIKRDLYMPDRITLQVINNSSLILLPGPAPVTYNTCRDMPVGADVKVADLQVDRQLCVITAEGRRGMLKVTKASTVEDPQIGFSAVVWSEL